LFVILDQYADWEAALVAAAINDIDEDGERYAVKTVSLTREPVRSIGGFTVLPDCDLGSAPKDAAAILLIGGRSWRKPEAAAVAEQNELAYGSALLAEIGRIRADAERLQRESVRRGCRTRCCQRLRPQAHQRGLRVKWISLQ
jgi:hypothetical protein